MPNKRPIEPMFWSLFGAGGAISALFLPALLFFTGIALPLGWVESSPEYLKTLVDPWYSKLLILGIVSLSLFHWAHRFRFTLHEGLQLHPYDRPIAIVCYGSAALLSGFTAFSLWAL